LGQGGGKAKEYTFLAPYINYQSDSVTHPPSRLSKRMKEVANH